jgi:hypothetical protein
VEKIRGIRFVGGSTDTDGTCFDANEITAVTKIAYVNERERSAALCDIPIADQDGILHQESSDCRVIGLTTNQFQDTTLTCAEPNEGFKGVGKYCT